MQKQPLEVPYKKSVLKSFAIFPGKQLCWSLFLIQNIAKFLRPPILKNICEQLLVHKELSLRNFKFTLKNRIFQYQYQKLVKMSVFISWLISFRICFHIQYFFDVLRNKHQTVNIC